MRVKINLGRHFWCITEHLVALVTPADIALWRGGLSLTLLTPQQLSRYSYGARGPHRRVTKRRVTATEPFRIIWGTLQPHFELCVFLRILSKAWDILKSYGGYGGGRGAQFAPGAPLQVSRQSPGLVGGVKPKSRALKARAAPQFAGAARSPAWRPCLGKCCSSHNAWVCAQIMRKTA